jgi:hypothetical protein
MKLVRILLVITACTIAIFSCRKEKSLEGGKLIQELHSQWQFRESSLQFNGPMDSAFIQAGATSVLTMVGSDSSGKGQIVLQLTGNAIAKGLYNNSQVLFEYSENNVVLYQNVSNNPGAFNITITALDSVSVSGTFSGTVQDGLGNSKTIAEGKFTAFLTGDYNPPPSAGTGTLTVWSKQLCAGGGSIEVTAGNQTGIITVAMAQEPVCGTSGLTTITLPAGPYTVIAKCGTDTVKYDITIIENICTILEIKTAQPPLPGDFLPLTLGTYWTYQDLANPALTNTVTVDGVENNTNAGHQYTRLLNSFGDTSLYRKEGSVYYEYRTLDFQSSISNPPTVEIVILHDDYLVGQTWETPGMPVQVSGIPIYIKLVSGISRRDFEDVYFGKTYSNLIEVTTELMFSFDNGLTYENAGSSFTTIFAKGIGVVYYNDLNRLIEWGLKDYHLNP